MMFPTDLVYVSDTQKKVFMVVDLNKREKEPKINSTFWRIYGSNV